MNRIAMRRTGASLPDGLALSPPASAQPLRRYSSKGWHHNADVEWDRFDSDAYWSHNYATLRKDDAQIIATVGAFFSGFFRGQRSRYRSGLDVGSGANLYPCLSMLPWCSEVTLTDRSSGNCEWLERELDTPRREWSPFWSELAEFPGYEKRFPCELLGRRVRVEQLSVFDLPKHSYDIGTMFFVAESMTNYETEFVDATQHFLDALRPGAPFAAAFMDGSQGYLVGDQWFPAVREVTTDVVRATLRRFQADEETRKVDIPAGDPLREGYDGMIISVGTTKA